jgi:hypothetical protein
VPGLGDEGLDDGYDVVGRAGEPYSHGRASRESSSTMFNSLSSPDRWSRRSEVEGPDVVGMGRPQPVRTIRTDPAALVALGRPPQALLPPQAADALAIDDPPVTGQVSLPVKGKAGQTLSESLRVHRTRP